MWKQRLYNLCSRGVFGVSGSCFRLIIRAATYPYLLLNSQMLDLPLLKKKKKKTGFNLDAALELTSSPSEERAEESTTGNDEAGAADEGTANAGDDFDLDMDFSKIKKKKKKTKKAIDELLPEKGEDDNQDDRENGRSTHLSVPSHSPLSYSLFHLHALTIPRDSSRIRVNRKLFFIPY